MPLRITLDLPDGCDVVTHLNLVGIDRLRLLEALGAAASDTIPAPMTCREAILAACVTPRGFGYLCTHLEAFSPGQIHATVQDLLHAAELIDQPDGYLATC